MTRGETMRMWRERAGLSQYELADALGLSIDEYVGHKVVKYKERKC